MPPVAQPVPPVAQPVPPVAVPVGLLTALLPDPEPVTRARPSARCSRRPASWRRCTRSTALEQLEQLPAPVPAPAEAPVEPAVEVPWAVSPALDVLPSGSTRGRRSARDLVLPAVLLAELLTGVWLGTAKPWQGESADPLQARFSSTAPASDDLRLPEPVPRARRRPAARHVVPAAVGPAERRDVTRRGRPGGPLPAAVGTGAAPASRTWQHPGRVTARPTSAARTRGGSPRPTPAASARPVEEPP